MNNSIFLIENINRHLGLGKAPKEELAITLDQDALFESQLSASEVSGTFDSLTTGMNVFMILVNIHLSSCLRFPYRR